ncbi:MAG TPA: hypothetical protein ENJ43_00845 [Gammaproteobacteria bacterium]|nr:hypothetical protein [Gammaproteobacteria bacterium]
MRKIYVPFLCCIMTILPLSATASDQTITLFPSQHSTITGSHSNQYLTALATPDMRGTWDNWNSYREFYPAANGYEGIFSFRLPAKTDRSTIKSLQLKTNYRGSEANWQLWQWQLRDFQNNRWITIGDNSMATSWQWSPLSFAANGNPDRYIDREGILKVRYLTTRSVDVSNIDYLSLQVTQTAPSRYSWWRPSLTDRWQIQLYAQTPAQLDTNVDADIFAIDIFNYDLAGAQRIISDLHRKGRRVVCYFSAGSYEGWRFDAYKFRARPEVLGKQLANWPQERWLDIRRLDILGPIMEARLDYLRSAGCDGVDPDNVDGYINDNGFTEPPLLYEDQLRYNRWLIQQAHKRGLGIGLKNNVAQIPDLVMDYDWAINESCYKYSECDRLSPFIGQGKPVLHIEYDFPTDSFCGYTSALGLYSQRKNRLLDAWYQNCR